MTPKENAVVLWTGGKDSCLALHIAQEQNFNIVGLVTFVPVGNSEFRAHPQSEIEEQAKRLGLRIHFLEVHEPYKETYIKKLKWIKSNLHVTTVINGDINYVDGCDNWIVGCCKRSDLAIFQPLWQKERNWVMDQLLSRGIQARINFISHPSIPAEWNGRIIDQNLLRELRTLSKDSGIDLAGENGEYHTMVVSAPNMQPQNPSIVIAGPPGSLF